MNRREFWDRLMKEGPLLLDGATGTNLQAAGLPTGVSPEAWVLEHPEVLADLQRSFYAAGSDIVYAFTFGANRIKLQHHGIAAAQVEDLNARLAKISCAVRDEVAPGRTRQPLVAGDLAPTGEFLRPAGALDFDELVDIYRQQVRGLLRAGVDLFVAETMLDLAQTRAAVLAVRAECDLAVLASLTVEPNGRTLSGNSIHECVTALAACGADAVGLNCSFGPDGLGQIVREALDQSPIPLLVKPNAGLPRLVAGKTVFDMTPAHFAQAMSGLVQAGVLLAGGCCGTRPDHLAALSAELKSLQDAGSPRIFENIAKARPAFLQRLSSARQTVEWAAVTNWPTLVVDDPDDLQDQLLDAAEDEPAMIALDITAITAGNLADFLEALDMIQMTHPIPLAFKGQDAAILQTLLRRYHGRAGVISPRQIWPEALDEGWAAFRWEA